MQLPVIDFIQTRIAESNTGLEVRQGTAFYNLFIEPQQLMLQPLAVAMETVLVSQSIRRILALDDPDSFDQNSVDDLAANVFVDRDQGGFAQTTVRVFYQTPVDREFPAFTAEFVGTGNLSFFNSDDFSITQADMALQQSGNLFFMDVPVRAQAQGDGYNVSAGGITTFVNDPDAVSCTNLSDAVGGLPTETNTQLLTRSKNSIGVRDLETIKGINAILREKFPTLREIQAVGFGDPEMQRDILYNAHIGGKTDIYLKTPALQKLSTQVIGLQFDTTRQVPRNVHKQLTEISFDDVTAALGTPFIVTNSVTIKDDVVETAAQFITASIPAITGINLQNHEYIKLQLDLGSLPMNIKVSGATPAFTQRFEVINALNAAFGVTIATPYGADQVLVKSPTTGATSALILSTPDSPRTDALTALTPLVPSAAAAGYVPSVSPATFSGVAAQVYVENVDYQVDYLAGKIIQLPGSAILSGRTIVGPATNGSITSGSALFQSPIAGAFSQVRAGDSLVITASTGIAAGTYIVSQKISNTVLQIQSFVPTGTDATVNFSIVSNQVVVITYQFNPLSVDIGPNILLADGLSRGVRPGRDAFTIKDVAFVDVISIEEIDPDTLEGLGVFLAAPGGYGFGGYGENGYGGNGGGDYELIVNDPTARFSALEDSMLIFDPSLFGKSYQITYYAATEIAQIHAVCRNDLERVTGADVLPKNFVPAFVDMTIGIRRDPTNLNTPDDPTLATLVGNAVDAVLSAQGLPSTKIIDTLTAQGVLSIQTPFTMTAEVVNTDGSTTVLQSQDVLISPAVVLPKQTGNFVTPNITHFYPRNISIIEVP